ncbi:NAD(P)H-dependent oxidoreductase subunit E [Candidatus Thiothrix sp. Deng01]|uniref:NAD(P)H-dependent oxidoreductase subunit E n=1 Tax=Candidatus Thiothrix phosphatis TaxID=3112415 RepID=A0ABU6D589_9GAMM|nr:NAD(P)H-dependent oxidoreductase subunit E [Candidatus Thiothrix sp. Deng01]MEB4593463.1 NAD(P)H-dependent oxidoreductase subunit E [Candidatus Thiothrix sp. Deng01]
MSYYHYHVFFCTNQREDGEVCCANFDAQTMRDYAKKRIKTLGLHKDGRCRINTAGCLNRCAEGPVAVVYPEAVWYTWVDQDDIDEIIESHLQNGQPVKRLMLDPQ